VPAESDFLVLFPDELPNTGGGFNWLFLAVAFALLVLGSLIGFLNLRSTSAKSSNRNGKD
jgi:LPXTG-motif cell wall-anchored protein